MRKQIADDISTLKRQGAKIIIVSFHWGVERNNYPNSTHVALGRYAVDSGASLVLGHHPHIIVNRKVTGKKEFKVIPTSISSVKHRN